MRKRWMYLIALGLAAVSIPLTAKADDLWGVPNIQQQYSKWCWVATGTSIVQYMEVNKDQCAFYKDVKGKPWWYWCSSSDNVGGSIQDVTSGLQASGIFSKSIPSRLPWGDITYHISTRKRPYIAYWSWKDPNVHAEAGHMVTGKGWTRADCNGDGVLENYVGYMEPLDGSYRFMEYNSFVDNWEHSWLITITVTS